VCTAAVPVATLRDDPWSRLVA